MTWEAKELIECKTVDFYFILQLLIWAFYVHSPSLTDDLLLQGIFWGP